jgi:hypothetical protein
MARSSLVRPTFRGNHRGLAAGVAVAALMGVASSASAQIIPPPNMNDPFIIVHAQAPGLDGWLNIPWSAAGILPNGYEWNLTIQGGGSPIVITDTNTNAPIVTVSQLRSAVTTLTGGIQSCALSFVVTAGSLGASLTFSSAVGAFPAISPAEGRASAQFGITDSNGDGALATFNGVGGTAYLAEINGVGAGAPDFAYLIPGGGIAVGPNQSTNPPADTFPVAPGAFSPIGVPVTSMHTQYDFDLTPLDQASGSSNFFVRVPAPGVVSLLGLGAVVALRRRR